MFTLDNISVYILNWKKVTENSIQLYRNINPIIKNTKIINCDENYKLDESIEYIQLDDSHYYGSQYNHAIKDVKKDQILCVITGDNIADNNFDILFNKAINTFNTYNLGVYSPNDKRSAHSKKLEQIKDQLYNVPNTDCGFWFINPEIINRLKNINYSISKMGWGIDVIVIEECRRKGFLVIRDYSVETDQLDHKCGYSASEAGIGWKELTKVYELYKLNDI